MAKQSLAVKYRPQTFSDVCEQDAIKSILLNQLNTKTFKHSYLFCGPAGCGKTTAARIFANEINEGKGSPIEIDAASNSGVDNIRTVIEEAKKKSLDSEYKIYIMDECHSFSSGAWQALLKLIEEPPKFAIFILCTTDPQKIPNTILSRVQRYNFSKISINTINQRLITIIENENKEDMDMNITYTHDSLAYIAKLSNGGMRDAITSLDKCLSLNTEVDINTVVKALGVSNYLTYFDILESFKLNDYLRAINKIENVFNSGIDLKLFIKNYYFFLIDVATYAMFKSFEYCQIPSTADNIQQLEKYEYIEIIKLMKMINELNNLIKWEQNPLYIIKGFIMIKGEENGEINN